MRIALLAGLFAGLLFLENSAAPVSADASATHRPLVDSAELASPELTGFALTIEGARHEYKLIRGNWRCVTAFGAVGEPRLITDLTRSMLTRTAAWRAPSPLQGAALFGFDAPLRVEFFRSDPGGPSLVFLLGERVASPTGSSVFIRREGVDGVWELDASELEPLWARRGAEFPPLLDQRLTAGCLLDPSHGVTRAFIDFEAGPSFELRPESHEGGVRWMLTNGVTQSEVLPYRLAGWLAFLQRAPYAGFANPQSASDLGLDPPAARVTLFPPEVPPIELVLGREVEGRVYLLNVSSGMLLLLPQDWSALIAPDEEALTLAEGGNPWETWLR